MVRNDNEFARVVPADECIKAVLAGQVRCLKLSPGHVGRIQSGAGRFLSCASHERRVAIEPVPGTVVQFRVPALCRHADRSEPFLVIVTVRLAPEKVVHDLRRFDELQEHCALVVRQVIEVTGQGEICINIRPGLADRRRRRFVRHGCRCRGFRCRFTAGRRCEERSQDQGVHVHCDLAQAHPGRRL